MKITTGSWKQGVKASGRRNLLLSLGAIALIWCVVLPCLSRSHRNAAYLEWLEENRIDPSAMFYTELDCAERLLQPGGRLAVEEK